MVEIYPSLISSDLLNLENTLKEFNSRCDGYHIDVMDNHFVPNLTWGPAFVNALLSRTKLPLHVHLMVDDPYKFLEPIKFRRNDIFCFHYESFKNDNEIFNLIEKVKSKDIKVSIAIKPKTEPELIAAFLGKIDQVLIMSVEPGFSGQQFLNVNNKIKYFADLKLSNKCSFKIAIDGGINHENIKKLHDLGVEQFSIASAIFYNDNPVQALESLYRSIG